MSAVEKLLLNAGELALSLGIPLRTLELLVARGDFPAPLRLGRHRKWRIEDVNAWASEKAAEAKRLAKLDVQPSGEGDQNPRGP